MCVSHCSQHPNVQHRTSHRWQHAMKPYRYWSKIAISHFLHIPPAFDAPVRVPVGILPGFGMYEQKNGLRWKKWRYDNSFWHTTRTWQTVKWTDGRTDTTRRHGGGRPRLCIASRRGKNCAYSMEWSTVTVRMVTRTWRSAWLSLL